MLFGRGAMLGLLVAAFGFALWRLVDQGGSDGRA
jgi:hypothetical protein